MKVLKHFVEEGIGSIGGIETFWGIRTFLVKKSYMKI